MNLIAVGHSVSHYRQRMLFETTAQLGVKTVVVGPEQWGDEHYSSYKKKNFVFKTIPITGPSSLYTFSFKGLNRIISAFRPAIIYCMEEMFSLFARECITFAKEYDCSLVFFTWENKISYRLSEPFDRIEQEAIREADKIICGNELARKRMINCGADLDKLHVLLQSGVDMELFKPVEEINKIFDLVYHGRMVREKGLPFLENVTKELNMSLLWIGGRGGYHPKWGDLRDWTKYEDLPGFINSAKIGVQIPFSFQGYQEQGNFSALECASCQLPVIISDNGSLFNNFKGSPMVQIKEGDENQLKEKLLDLINDENKQKILGEQSREWVKNNFSVEIIAKKLLNVLELN
jgi:glycosyltransferase involved in cell wall biosynthesis